METRIKYIKKNTGWWYAIQVKKWIFWKTIETHATFEDAERVLNTMKDIDGFNNKTKSLNKIVYEGYGVRDIFPSGGVHWRLGFFTTYPKKTKRMDGGINWSDAYGDELSLINIKLPKLFGKECLEPMKLRIIIEQIDE